DGADAHGDGVAGHVGLAEEVAGGVAAGERVEGDQAGAGVAAGAGLVEADVAGAADAEDLEIEAAGVADAILVGLAAGEDFGAGHGAVGHVDVFGRHVDVVEELVVHEAPVTLGVGAGEAVVFVEVEGDDVLERQAFLAVQADELAVEAHGGGAGGEAEDGAATLVGALADEGGDLGGKTAAGGVGGGVELGGDAFALPGFGGVHAMARNILPIGRK